MISNTVMLLIVRISWIKDVKVRNFRYIVFVSDGARVRVGGVVGDIQLFIQLSFLFICFCCNLYDGFFRIGLSQHVKRLPYLIFPSSKIFQQYPQNITKQIHSKILSNKKHPKINNIPITLIDSFHTLQQNETKINLYQYMIIQAISTGLILLILILAYLCYIKPKKSMKFYEKQFAGLNYRTKVFPYKPLYNKYFDPIFEGRDKGDPYGDYKTTHQNYDLVLSNVYHIPFLELIHVDFIRDFYAVDRHYDYPKPVALVQPFVRLTGPILAFTQGSAWKHRKTILSNIFNFEFLKSQISKIVQISDRQFLKMQEACQDKGQDEHGKFVNIHLFNELFINVASQVVLTSILGVKQRHQIEGIQIAKYLSKTVDDLMKYQLESFTVALGEWFYNAQLRKIDKSINHREEMLRNWGKLLVRQKIKAFQKQIQEKGIKNVEIDDTIKSIIVYKKQNNLEDDNPLVSEDQIFRQFLGFFIGGTDSTANYFNMMVSFIGKYSHVEKRFREQIELYMKEDNYSFENLKNFKYIEAIQKETTRIYGPTNIIFFRQALRDNYINGVAVKKGTLVSVNTIPNCFSQKYFKDPLEFRPERWLNGQCDNLPQFVVTGFSAGARTCIGKQLAMLETKIGLIKFMKRYKKIQIPNKNFKMSHKFLVCPEDFKTKLYIDSK